MSHNTQSTSPGSRGTFESTIRDMWATRPVRFPRSQSPRTWFFGVCEGIAVRYQVSPVLVRLLFVLLACTGGVGVWAYGAAILLFRRYSVPKTPLEVLLRSERDPRYDEDRSIAIGTLIVGAIFLVLGGVFSGGITLGGLVIAIGVTGLIWWLLYERTPAAPEGLLATDVSGVATDADAPVQDVPTVQDAPTVNLDDITTAEGFDVQRRQPPSWDPLGTAPFAWDLPDPGIPEDEQTESATAAPKKKKKKRRGLMALLIGVILAVVLAVSGVFGALFSGWGGVANYDGEDYSGTMVGDSVRVEDLDGTRSVNYTMSSQTMDFGDTAVNGDSTIDLNTTMSTIVLQFPERTDGDSYVLDLNCDSRTMSEVDCESMDGTVIEGSGDDGDDAQRHTLTVNIKATMSDIRVEQFG
ncbi:MAG TPA: PspC domain-containing protein [Candidatus Corynebacterium avicola]|uniref:PspC domain-containing protein n=1 Tax=Candidatus Corynebacterium avicola TaxID=2838527 RepID=A0A9D1RSK8_9CORY|nr:PspC domain-containing protein [Candidatus Corynebacterium avicola]